MTVSDQNRSLERRTPIFNVPSVVIAIIVALVLIQAYRSQLSPIDDFTFVALRGFVPARLALDLGWLSADDIVSALAEQGQPSAATIAFLKLLTSDDADAWTSLLTYAGLHGDWGHLTLNSLWFLAFGSVVARRLGASLFLMFFIASSIGAALVYAAFNLASVVPMIGASGAVSAAMGAALLLPFRPVGDPEVLKELQMIPLMPVSVALRDQRVISTTVIWFGLNGLMAFGFGAGLTGQGEPASIAWEAHLGGYIIGMVLIYALDRYRPLPDLKVPETLEP